MGYYNKQTWSDRNGTGLNRFTYTMDDTYITLTQAPISLTNTGTAVSADRMNNLENGLAAASWSFGTADPSTLTNPKEGQLYFKIVG